MLNTTPLANITDQIIAYENGTLPDDQFLPFFQSLIDSGLAWSLQGMYGRAAAALLRAGKLQATTDTAKALVAPVD